MNATSITLLPVSSIPNVLSGGATHTTLVEGCRERSKGARVGRCSPTVRRRRKRAHAGGRTSHGRSGGGTPPHHRQASSPTPPRQAWAAKGPKSCSTCHREENIELEPSYRGHPRMRHQGMQPGFTVSARISRNIRNFSFTGGARNIFYQPKLIF